MRHKIPHFLKYVRTYFSPTAKFPGKPSQYSEGFFDFGTGIYIVKPLLHFREHYLKRIRYKFRGELGD